MRSVLSERDIHSTANHILSALKRALRAAGKLGSISALIGGLLDLRVWGKIILCGPIAHGDEIESILQLHDALPNDSARRRPKP